MIKDDKMLGKQLRRFILSGLLATGTDLCVYYLLFNYVISQHSVAKGASFICGTIVAYLFNKYITFAKTTHSWFELLKFVGLYAFTLMINIFINQQCLELFVGIIDVKISFVIAFLVATAFSTVLNFIGQKFFVFSGVSKA